MSDLVSVIIPTYNYGHYLEACIESVLAQSHRNLQVIVVDDGSTDDSRELLAEFKPRIKYIHQSNQGLSAARNTGLEAVEGDFVQLLDADDLLHPRAIEHRLACMSAQSFNDWVVCQNYYFLDKPPAKFPNPMRPRWVSILLGWARDCSNPI